LSLYYEDFTEGAEHVTRAARSRKRILSISLDCRRFHRAAHQRGVRAARLRSAAASRTWLLTLSIATGLMIQMNLVTDTVVAFYGIDKLRFVKPVFIGIRFTCVRRSPTRWPRAAKRA